MASMDDDLITVNNTKIKLSSIGAIKTTHGLYEINNGEVKHLELGYEYTTTDIFTSALLGLIANDFSGVVSVCSGDTDKKLYIKKGQIIFASSTLIDDRLGEVIYRRGLITLDQMTDAAVKVTRDLKFGRVMLESSIFDSIDLWDGLKLQVLCILQSIFLDKEIFYRISRDFIEPPTAVLFEESTELLVKKFASVGFGYQVFRDSLDENDSFELYASDVLDSDNMTYISDTADMIRSSENLGKFLSNRKLNESYSILDVFDLCHMGFMAIKRRREVKISYKKQGRNSTVKSLIDAYQMISREIHDFFKNSTQEFPLDELSRFLTKQYLESGCLLYIEPNLSLSVDSLSQIIAVSEKYNFACEMIESDLKALTYFILQILGDSGPGVDAWKLKQKLSALVL